MKLLGQHIDRLNALIAALVWLGVLIVYSLTKAPTMSFWDCGEFVAVAAILGVPHPPGTPLYILVANIFSVIPLFADIAARVNFLSSLSSSIAALFAYLTGVRILRSWFGDDSRAYTRLLVYGGAICGAGFLAFGFTQWINSVEAEVYGLSMAMFMAIIWLTVVYADVRGTGTANRVMLLIIYLAVLGIGVHMATFIIFPVAALFFILRRSTPATSWYLLALFIVIELFLIFIYSSRPGEIPFYLPVVVVAIVYAFYVFSFEQVPASLWIFTAGFLVSILPVFGLLYSLWAGQEFIVGSEALTTVAGIGLLATLAFAVYTLSRYSKMKASGAPPDMHLLYPPLFVIVAAALAGLVVSGLQGYGVFLLSSIILLIVTGYFIRQHIRWLYLIAIIAVGMIIIGLKPFFWAILISAVIIPVLGKVLKTESWRTAMLILLVAVLGFSVHLFIPIRSAQDPYINQNTPARSLDATVNFIERKQYGSQSMVERMFKRRAEWSNQFGDFHRMGFWHFFQDQYGLTGPRFFVLFILGLFGAWEIVRRRPRIGLFFLVALLVTSVGLILYMNFADGTRMTPRGQDYIEVRDRDYFFTSAFMLFGLAIGLGVATFIQFLREGIAKFSPGIQKIILACATVLIILPTYALGGNYFRCDRSNNHIAYDYAWNLLQSADPGAVLFTNGDNDTFPLWCLQEAYGIRKDVINVNLALANTDWYIKQIRDYMGLELGWTDEQIDGLRNYRRRSDGKIIRISNQVIDAVILNNFPERTINFSVTCSPSAREFRGQSLDSYLTLSGMKWRLRTEQSETGTLTMAIEESEAFFLNPELFRYRGLDDPTVFKNETHLRVTRNMANSVLMVADTLRRAGELERAEKLAYMSARHIPNNEDGLVFLTKLYADLGAVEKFEDVKTWAPTKDLAMVAVYQARAMRKAKRTDEAKQLLDSLLVADPHLELAFDESMRLLIEQEDYVGLAELLERFVANNPEHERARNALASFQKEMLRYRQEQEGQGAGSDTAPQ